MTNTGVTVEGSSSSIPRKDNNGAATTTRSPVWTCPAAQYQLQSVVACVADECWWVCWEACPTAWTERTPPSMRSMATKQAAINGDRSVRIKISEKSRIVGTLSNHFQAFYHMRAHQKKMRVDKLPGLNHVMWHLNSDVYRICHGDSICSGWSIHFSLFIDDETWSISKTFGCSQVSQAAYQHPDSSSTKGQSHSTHERWMGRPIRHPS